MGQAIYRVDPKSGRVEVGVAAPEGEADDLELAADGTLYFAGFMHGTLSARDPDGRIRVLARGLPGMNSLALDARGRLFGTQVFAGDALWEFDRAGKQAPRLVRKDLGGLNGFDFSPDGRLCGPLWFRAQVVCLDVDSGAMEVVADGFTTPAAANFDPKGELHAIDNATGEVFHIDLDARRKTRIATAPTNLDNLAFSADGRLFVTDMPDNAIYEVDRESGAIRTVVAASETHLATASLHRGSAALWDLASMQVVARWSDLGKPSAIAFGAGNRVVVATAEGALIELDAAKPERRHELARDLAYPEGIAALADGPIAVADTAADRVILVDPKTGQKETIATGLPLGVLDLPGMPPGIFPTGLATTDEGALLLSSDVEGGVLRLRPRTQSRTAEPRALFRIRSSIGPMRARGDPKSCSGGGEPGNGADQARRWREESFERQRFAGIPDSLSVLHDSLGPSV